MTPNEAGLIEVDLKRKVEYKNSHTRQLINPKKCFKMLEETFTTNFMTTTMYTQKGAKRRTSMDTLLYLMMK